MNGAEAQNGTGSDVIVSFAPSYNLRIMTEDPHMGRVSRQSGQPNQIGLGHELIHAEHYMDVDFIPESQKSTHSYIDASGNTVTTRPVKTEELRTVGLSGVKKDDITENQLRKENNVDKRGAY